MERVYTIGLDVHCAFTELVVLTPTGRIRERHRSDTTIPALAEQIERTPRPRAVVLEEGPMADWLGRGLAGFANDLAICDPRRNHLVAKDSDKDDPIDAEKLARLYQGGFIKRVHHPESFDRVVFKRHVGLYHESVSRRVSAANRIMAELRAYGVFVQEQAFAEKEDRDDLWRRMPDHPVFVADIRSLMRTYDATVTRENAMRRSLVRQARQIPEIQRFQALPGVKWIRAATFYVYVDTPWRFRSKSALWKYLGVGLERRHSGAGPEHVHVARLVNRTLKSTILGAAMSAAASKGNPFADLHERWIKDGVKPGIARRNVARRLSAVMWGMWKSGDVYRPERVGIAERSPA